MFRTAIKSDVDELNNEDLFTVYPNPAKDVIKIKINLYDNEDVIIYDILSRVVIKSNINESIDISKLELGIYYISIKINNVNYLEKLIKN